MILIIILIVSFALAVWVTYDAIPLKEKKKYTSRFEKFKIPSQFWDDYNKINFFIHDMGIDECEKVRFLIDDFTYKYAEIMDYKVFIDSISVLITKYNDKEKQLLKFKLN
jgi:hypothetical protein